MGLKRGRREKRESEFGEKKEEVEVGVFFFVSCFPSFVLVFFMSPSPSFLPINCTPASLWRASHFEIISGGRERNFTAVFLFFSFV